MDLNLQEKDVGKNELFERKEKDILKENNSGTTETHWNFSIQYV